MPGWRRTAWRTGPAAAVLFALYGWAAHRVATETSLAIFAAAGGAAGAWRAYARIRNRKHHRTWLTPLHMRLAPVLKVPLPNRPESWLQVAADRSEVKLALPQGYFPDAKDKEKIKAIVATTLGLDNPEPHWGKLTGPEPYVLFTPCPAPPPGVVTFDDLRDAIGKAGPDELVWGTGTRGAVVKSSLSLDSPHIGLSVGSGGGKSVTGRLVGLQILHRGGVLAILDYKMTSQAWARGLPNVAYADTTERIHDLLLWLEYEMERRNEVAAAGTDIEGEIHANVGDRLFIIAEEMNATMTKLRRFWARECGADRSLPKRSPAIDAFENLLFMGRQASMNMLVITQKLSVRATGSGDARENMGTRILCRATGNNWKSLVDDFPYPGKTSAPGRMHVVTDELREVQIARASGREARQMALSGAVAAPRADMPCVDHKAARSTGAAELENPGPGLPESLGNGGPVNSPGVTLREAAGTVVGYRLLTLRTYRSTDKAFPRPVGKRGLDDLYDPVAMSEWEAGRRT